VGGATFAAAIEHVAPRGLVVNLATGRPDELVSFRAGRFDRSPGARIHTFNLLDELPQMDAAGDLAIDCQRQGRERTAGCAMRSIRCRSPCVTPR
jgi:hypothetical protein